MSVRGFYLDLHMLLSDGPDSGTEGLLRFRFEWSGPEQSIRMLQDSRVLTTYTNIENVRTAVG